MSEELDEYKSEQFNREQEAYSAIEKQFEDVNRKLNSFFNLFLTGEPDSVFVEMMADRDKFHSGDLWIHGIGQRVSYLEMKAGGGIIELPEKKSPVRDFNREPERKKFTVNIGRNWFGQYPPLFEEQSQEEVELAQGVCDDCGHSITEHAPKARGYAQECTGVKFKGVESPGGHCGCKRKFYIEPETEQSEFPNEQDKYIIKMSQVKCSNCTHVGHRHHAKGTACEEIDCSCRRFISRETTTIERVNFEMDLADRLNPLARVIEKLKKEGEAAEVLGRRTAFRNAVAIAERQMEITTAELSASYSKSAQSEPSPQYEERQSSFRFQCRAQHAQIVVDLLVHMASTSGLNHREVLEKWREQFSRTWLALSKCEAVECQVSHRLVEQALNSPPLE